MKHNLWPSAWGAIIGCLTIMFAVYITKEPTCLWGLLLVVLLAYNLTPDTFYTPDNYRTRCPRCDCKFLAEQLNDDDEE
ncbi:MAG: hypothetical protein AAB847_03030 [Patescibacteria group bacterium]